MDGFFKPVDYSCSKSLFSCSLFEWAYIQPISQKSSIGIITAIGVRVLLFPAIILTSTIDTLYFFGRWIVRTICCCNWEDSERNKKKCLRSLIILLLAIPILFGFVTRGMKIDYDIHQIAKRVRQGEYNQQPNTRTPRSEHLYRGLTYVRIDWLDNYHDLFNFLNYDLNLTSDRDLWTEIDMVRFMKDLIQARIQSSLPISRHTQKWMNQFLRVQTLQIMHRCTVLEDVRQYIKDFTVVALPENLMEETTKYMTKQLELLKEYHPLRQYASTSDVYYPHPKVDFIMGLVSSPSTSYTYIDSRKKGAREPFEDEEDLFTQILKFSTYTERDLQQFSEYAYMIEALYLRMKDYPIDPSPNILETSEIWEKEIFSQLNQKEFADNPFVQSLKNFFAPPSLSGLSRLMKPSERITALKLLNERAQRVKERLIFSELKTSCPSLDLGSTSSTAAARSNPMIDLIVDYSL